eukprot:TRINITY_DN12399_c1_g1_i1.p1 TRINITY_DN12399_c1_g1~~TRINITY_DN12399_c1_g1_i1.p1  ORF type:complete len:236 (-),score=43.55 TRINITY_DN12399_c1_g1_i1:499-1206(-)
MSVDICSAIVFLHSKNLVNRDIKSPNILVTKDYQCKLCDFGTSKIVKGKQLMHTKAVGSPLWMAPEVQDGKYDFSIDIYSFGMVLFEIFNGAILPFWNKQESLFVPPSQYRFDVIIKSCIGPKQFRPTASDLLSKLMDGLNMTLKTLFDGLPPKDQNQLQIGKYSHKNLASQQHSSIIPLDKKHSFLMQELFKAQAFQVDQVVSSYEAVVSTQSTGSAKKIQPWPSSMYPISFPW